MIVDNVIAVYVSLHKLYLDREISNNNRLAMTINPYKHGVRFVEHSQAAQTQIAASDHGLHRLHTDCSIENWANVKYHPTLLKLQMWFSL